MKFWSNLRELFVIRRRCRNIKRRNRMKHTPNRWLQVHIVRFNAERKVR